MPPASAGDVARDLVVPAGLAAGALVTSFHVLAIFVEAPLLAWSERVPARWFSSASLGVLALATLGAALAGSPLVFACALALYGPASGCALAASEGVLVESRPDERERTLARLSLAGALGDLAVPLGLGALAWAGLGWRTAMVVTAAVAASLAGVHASSRALDRAVTSDDEEDEDDESPSVLDALRLAFSTRPLLLWSIAAGLTSLLDEVLVAFVIVQLDAASALERAFAVGAWTVGVVLALFVLERFVDRVEPRRLLVACSVIVAACLVVLACTTDVVVASIALSVLGAATSPLHPLASARAYAALPGRPALVNAVASALGPFDAIAPLVLGALALAWGPEAAILAILIAPIGIVIAVWRAG